MGALENCQARFEDSLTQLATNTKDKLCGSEKIFNRSTYAAMKDVGKSDNLLRQLHGGKATWLVKNECLLWAAAVHKAVYNDFTRYDAAFAKYSDANALAALNEVVRSVKLAADAAAQAALDARFKAAAESLPPRQYSKFVTVAKKTRGLTQAVGHKPINWQPLELPPDLFQMFQNAAEATAPFSAMIKQMALHTHQSYRHWQRAHDGICPTTRVPYEFKQKDLERVCQKVTRSKHHQFCCSIDLVQGNLILPTIEAIAYAVGWVRDHKSMEIVGIENGFSEVELQNMNCGYRHLALHVKIRDIEHICEIGLHLEALHEQRRFMFDTGGQGRRLIWHDAHFYNQV